ncbi:hypothetical protein LTR78_008523 [Recurvomyces mirabilis]|uniref:Uncharacterized protein n=1 Tax=Recurvomyces mirabilis TaxID=574656 RepID=A0AAE0TPW6_9PEZI|nr:hypothetical protein LTR78_008523 [Recurvomyces mirabilis]KAK5156274.1 hypothetical protein LTS14_005162 [Recurvomyces mirabilis]
MFQESQGMPTGPPPAYEAIVASSQRTPAQEKATSERSLALSDQSYSSVDENDEILQTALDFSHHAPSAQISRQRLPGPVAIPQTAGATGMPFIRAYAPVLQSHGVSMKEFVEFVDNFNIVSASSPPLQVLDLASGAIGMIPMGHAQAISAGVQALVKIGDAVQMKTRAGLFVKKSNTDFFHPRGLKLELLTSAALKAKLGMDPATPIAGDIGQSEGLNATERKLAGLQGAIAPLVFDVPSPNEPTNVLGKITAKQQVSNAKRADKKALKSREKYVEMSQDVDEKLRKRTEKVEEEYEMLDCEREKIERKRDREMEKVARKEKDGPKWAREEGKVMKEFEKDMRKLEEDHEKVREKYEGKVGKREGKRVKKDKEARRAEKGVWLVIDSI